MKTHLVVLTAAALAVSGTAMAQRQSKVDGNKLLSLCTGSKTEQCDIYLSGVADAEGGAGKDKAVACIPDAVTGTQLREVVVKYLKAHPGDRQMKAGHLALRAYAEAFACSK